jgi:hypothetical protein
MLKFNIKQKILNIIVAVLSIVPLMPATSAALEQPISATFGQPHGYVVSGDFTFILQVHGKVDRVTFKVTKANDVNNPLGTYSATSVIPGTNGDNYYNLVWNSQSFNDGDYWLFANIENDSVSPNGWTDFARHVDGTGHLAFKVKNPVVTPPPVTQPPENTCSAKLEKAKQKAKQIYDKQNTNLLFIDNFLQQTTLFYQQKAPQSKDRDAQLVQVSDARKQASDSLVKLDKLNDFTCEGSLKEQVHAYLQQTSDTRDKLDGYKDSVINLILQVLEEVK